MIAGHLRGHLVNWPSRRRGYLTVPLAGCPAQRTTGGGAGLELLWQPGLLQHLGRVPALW
jgi:hypothetical protein